MFDRFMRQEVTRRDEPKRIDLASVRDTLLYIESDLDGLPELHRIADGIRAALAEIDRIELSDAPAPSPAIAGAHFLPAFL